MKKILLPLLFFCTTTVFSDKNTNVSLDFQDIPVQQVLQTLAELHDSNFIISDKVNGTISLHLKNVPWDQALQIILENEGLAQRTNGNIIRIGTIAEMFALDKQQ